VGQSSRSRLELALLDAFEDDEKALATLAPASLRCLFFPPPHPRLLPTTRCVASAVVPSPLFALAGPVVRKTAHEKTLELVVATVAAWVSSPDVNAPVMGAGSSLLDFYDNFTFSKTFPVVAVEALKRVSRASFSVEMLAIMVFLKKNAKFMPSVEEVVF
jgi:hypothetical protein